MFRRVILLLAVIPFVSAACVPQRDGQDDLEIRWTDAMVDSVRLPPSIRVLEGTEDSRPLRAWAVLIDLDDPGISLGTAMAEDPDGRARPTELAERSEACVLVNGGFYWLDADNRARSIGLVRNGGRTIEPALRSLTWRRVRYPVSRGTIGAEPGENPVITWAAMRGDSLVRAHRPVANILGRPGLPHDSLEVSPWSPDWALSAGPVLVSGGETRSRTLEEGFFDVYVSQKHPRSAAGLTADGKLLLVAVEGRHPYSRGVDLSELARIMHDLGATSALNLDGGGSSALVVGRSLLNRVPAEREIPTALIVRCDPNPAPVLETSVSSTG